MASIETLNLGDRIAGNLAEAGISAIEQLEGYTRDDLIALDGIGEVSADEILTALDLYTAEAIEIDEPQNLEEPDDEPNTLEALEAVEPGQEPPELKDRESLLLEACQWAIDVWRAMPGQQPMFLASRMKTKIDAAMSPD